LNKNWPATIVVSVGVWYLAFFTDFMAMWAGYVAMNLFVIVYSYMMITLYTAEKKLPVDGKFIFWVGIPAVFMTVTTVYALVYYSYRYFVDAEWQGFVIVGLCLILLILSFIQFFPKLAKWKDLKPSETMDA